MTRRAPWLATLVLLASLAGCSDPEPAAAPAATPTPDPDLPPPADGAAAADLPPLACSPCGVQTSDVRAVEPVAAIHPSDPQRLVVAAITGDPTLFVPGVGQPVQGPGWAGLSVRHSEDGGATWAEVAIPRAGSVAPSSAWSAYCVEADPVLEYVGDEVRLYGLGWPCSNGSRPHLTTVGSVWMAVSRDNGATWSEPRSVVRSPGAVEWPDKEWAATDPADPQRILATWLGLQNPGTTWELRYAVSGDGGSTWSAPASVTDGEAEGGASLWSAMPAWGPDGTAYVSFRSCEGGCVKVARSQDLASWTVAEVAEVQAVQREGGQAMGTWHPSLAVDRATGFVAVSWHGDGGAGDSDAFVAFSRDGADWAAPVRIPGLAGAGEDQWWPFVASDGQGGFHGILYDRSGDADNLRTQAVGWRVASGRLDVAAAGPAWNVSADAFAFYGDYIGVGASPAGAVAAWGQMGDDGFRTVHAARFPR